MLFDFAERKETFVALKKDNFFKFQKIALFQRR